MRKNSKQQSTNKSRNETKWNDGDLAGTPVYPSLRYAPFRLLLPCTLALLLLTAPFALADGNDHRATAIVEWFDGGTAGYIGGTLGSALGIIGGLFGCFAWFFIWIGKGRWLIGALIFVVIIGAILLAIGLLALCLGQPWHVSFIFLYPGLFVVILFSIFAFMTKKMYDAREMEKMQTLDRSDSTTATDKLCSFNSVDGLSLPPSLIRFPKSVFFGWCLIIFFLTSAWFGFSFFFESVVVGYYLV